MWKNGARGDRTHYLLVSSLMLYHSTAAIHLFKVKGKYGKKLSLLNHLG